MSRQLAYRLGRDGPTQRFSASSEERTTITAEIEAAIRASTDPQVRTQTLSDPTKCFQYACLWGTQVDALTRPELVQNHPNPPVVLGSFSDKIGHAVPVSISVEDFRGFFTTLVPVKDADLFQLTRHPTSPDLIRGPPETPANPPAADAEGMVDPEPQPATLARLQFPMPENPSPGDYPVVVALPCYLPLAPGQSLPPNVDITKPESYATAAPLFQLWCRGLHYAYHRNASHSVTLAGPLFHLPDLSVGAGEEPFPTLPLQPTLPLSPHLLPPHFTMYKRVLATITALSDEAWVRLGSQEAARSHRSSESPHSPSPGVTPEQLQAILTPFVQHHSQSEKSTKESEQSDSARDVAAAYKLAFAALPTGTGPSSGSVSPSAPDSQVHMVLPSLDPKFETCLNKVKPVPASQLLQDLVRAKVDASVSSELAWEVDITFDPNAVTTAFSNNVRSFFWLTNPLTRTTYEGAKWRLGLLHFLKPAQGFCLLHTFDEATQTPIVLSHVSDDKAQLEASKASSLYTGGCLAHGMDIYYAICNLLMLISVMLPTGGPTPLLVEKLKTYASVLRSPDGRVWCDTYRNDKRVIAHLYQDCQHIITVFLAMGIRPNLKEALLKGQPVDARNYWNAARHADSFIDRLRSLVTGNSLGDFLHTPHTLTWFAPDLAKQLSTPVRPPKNTRDVTPQNFRTPPTMKGTPTQATAPKKLKMSDQADVERRKLLGILTFDKKVGGNRLPHCPVYAKASKDSSSQERLCMQFATQGHYCSRTNCPFPHIPAVARLPKEARDELVKWVTKTPGLDFAPGKGPAGTP